MSFKARVKPPNSVWFEDAKLKNLIICQPENRNRFNKIFGGFIMRQAGLRIRIRINLSCWIRIQEGKNNPQK
jgi:hypothetical protein